MKLTDLKLLVDCASDDDVNGYRVPVGFDAAKKRLLKLGMVEQYPFNRHWVRITDAGLKRVAAILKRYPK